jgi:tetratricopeptide (TPR) repeat protein
MTTKTKTKTKTKANGEITRSKQDPYASAPTPGTAYARAVEHHSAGRMREAVADYRAAVLEEPERARIRTNFALALNALGNEEEAMRQALLGATIRPDDPYVAGNAIDLLISSDQYDVAVEMAEAFLDGDALSGPSRPRGRVDLVYTPYAQALLALDRDEEALAAADNACQGDHNNANAFVTYAQALGVHHRVDEALTALDRAEQLAPGHATIAEVRGTIDALAAEMSSVIDRAHDDALKHDHCDHWCVLGGVLHRMGRFIEARAAFAEAIARDPESADAWWGHGIALQALGDRFPQDVQSLQHAGALHAAALERARR